MKTTNKLIKKVATILLTICLSIPASSLTAYAAESNNSKADMTFIPFRDQIPYYLSTNSDSKSELVKKLWAKLFYEELNWSSGQSFYDSNYDAWWKKYKGTTYIGLDGQQKNISGQITYSTGDFEAFIGNTLEANPEFLGQLLGLPDYEPLSTDENGITFLRNVIGKYLLYSSHPTRFDKYFVNSIVNLTKDGKYLDENLSTVYCNGIRADYCMLSTLASRYRKTNLAGQQYLSKAQIEWIESYQLELYDSYTKGSSNTLKKLVSKNANLYDLIARSSYAANNRNKYGNIFFNYVVNSGKGAGAWLNLNNNINIPAMAGVDDLVSLFNLSDGWCGNSSNSSCYNHTNCINKATTNDIIAYALYRSAPALSYIRTNTKTGAAFGLNNKDENGWWYRYTVKHTKWSESTGTSTVQAINAASGKSERAVCHSQMSKHTGNGLVTCSAGTSITVYTKDLLYNASTKTGSNAPKSVTIGVWYEASRPGVEHSARAYKANSNNKNNDSTEYIKNISFDYSTGIIPPEAGVSEYNYTGSKPDTYGAISAYRYYTFDLQNLNYTQLQNGYITINTAASNFAYATARETEEWAYASCGAMPTVYVTCPLPDCDINGHNFDTRYPTWASDHSYVNITYTCSKDTTHSKTVRINNITASTSKGLITYKAIGAYNEPYTTVVSAGGTEVSVTSSVKLSSSNATDYYSSVTSSDIEESHQSAGMYGGLYTTSAIATIKGSVVKGIIPVGVRKITFNYVASEKMDELLIAVHSSSGKIIGRGGTNVTNSINKSNGTVTINLNASSDLDLYNSYITITGKASSTHTNSMTQGKPSPATATIGVTGMIFTY